MAYDTKAVGQTVGKLVGGLAGGRGRPMPRGKKRPLREVSRSTGRRGLMR